MLVLGFVVILFKFRLLLKISFFDRLKKEMVAVGI